MNGGLTFVHAALAGFAAMIAIPIIIHLIHRRKAEPYKFAAIKFVILSTRRTARAFKIKQLLLLMMRIIIIAAIPLAAARLAFIPKAQVESATEAPASVAIIIDNTYSMGYQGGDESYFERARRAAKKAIDRLPQSDDAFVMPSVQTVGAPLPSLVYDRDELYKAVEAVELTETYSGVASVVDKAVEALKKSNKSEYKIIYISDFARNGFDLSGSPFANMDNAPKVELIDVREGEAAFNYSVVSLDSSRDYEAGPYQWRITAAVRNNGTESGKQLKISIFMDGANLANGFAEALPGGEEAKTFTVKITQPGDHLIEARLAGDNLKLDDRRFAILSAPPIIKALLVNGDPSTTTYKDELFYLKNALDPQKLESSGIKTDEVTVDRLLKPSFDAYSVVFLCNVPTLPDAAVIALKEFVRKGGGLFISSGDSLQIDFYNDRMADLLPGELRSPTAAGGADAGAFNVTVGIAPSDSTGNPLLEVFDSDAKTALYGARFAKFQPFNPNPKKRKKFLFRLTNDQPLLTQYSFGEGNVFFFASTIDRDWNDFAIRTAFLPIIQESVKFISRSQAAKPPKPLIVGEKYKADLPDSASAAYVAFPDGSRKALKIEEERRDGQTVKFAEIPPFSRSGAYDLVIEGAKLSLKVAVNPDAAEGDMRPANKDELAKFFSSPKSGSAVFSSDSDSAKEFALYFALAALLAFLFENWLVRSMLKPE